VKPYYVDHSDTLWGPVFFQTGPVVLTVACIKGSDDEKDMLLNYKVMYYIANNHDEPHTPEPEGDIGALGYDIWNGDWGS
jgi:hypothetical protein